ncbi:hypothetical protein LDENG_00154280, partial [Lucifuga dentata]
MLHPTLTLNKTPRYLNSSVWGSDSPLTWREQSTFFLQSTMVSDLEVLILIPVTSHSASNLPSAHQRSLSDKTS